MFKKENFKIEGQWIHYNGKFVARVRCGSKMTYVNFLIRHFSEDEYFNLYNSGMAPLQILQSKGFISPNMRRVLKSYNLPTTQDGIKRLKEVEKY